MKSKMIAMSMMLLVSVSASAARVESEDVQAYGARANRIRAVTGATSMPEGDKCDFGQPVVIRSGLFATDDTFGRAVCNKA